MTTTSSFVRPDFLVDPAGLLAHSSDADLRIVDCSEGAEYRRAHIPGAHPLDLRPWLKHEETPHVIGPEAFSARMTALGVSSGTTVVAYDGTNGWLSGRLWWVLRYYGHERVRVLNGGWRAWVRSGYPVSVDPPAAAPADVQTAAFDARRTEDHVIHLEELRSALNREDVQIVNVLPPSIYRGDANPFGNARTGHLPGSVNIPNETFSGEGSLLESAAAIRAVFEAAGLSPQRETIVHCQAGVRSSYACLALTLAGWDRVRVYDASLAEWANRDDTPLA
ncbi:sulfurtransferase [Deinococcus aquaedulcis]|uniref:sulfurtransferase n=1 Tax=Deinococcus aquaedulcis TaxID=2840455 RepID=UPI001C83BD4F|nr:sulfurtransferase [Deinococcus aquaedulcis]